MIGPQKLPEESTSVLNFPDIFKNLQKLLEPFFERPIYRIGKKAMYRKKSNGNTAKSPPKTYTSNSLPCDDIGVRIRSY